MNRSTGFAAPPVSAVERVVAGNAVLRTVEQLGLLGPLARAPLSPAELAERSGHDTGDVTVLLEALLALDLVQRGPDGFRAHPQLPSLVTRVRTALGTLPDRVRTGRPQLAGDRPGEAGELYGQLAAPLGEFFGDVAEEVADLLAGPDLQVLDVGAGAAPWTRAIARRDRTTHVVACDLAPVLPATRTAVTDDDLHEQFDLVTCDVLAGPLPGDDHDLAVAANLCHLFDGPTAERIVKLLVDATRPGGTVAIIDALPDHQDPDRRRSVALYAAGLLTRTGTGGVHSFAAYRTWLTDAGCERVQRYDCVRFPTSLVTGRAR